MLLQAYNAAKKTDVSLGRWFTPCEMLQVDTVIGTHSSDVTFADVIVNVESADVTAGGDLVAPVIVQHQNNGCWLFICLSIGLPP